MNDTIAKRIRQYRKQAGMTQDDLAEKLHVTRQAVSSWETGRNEPDIETLFEISSIFGVEFETLICNKNTKAYHKFQTQYIALGAVTGLIVFVAIVIHIFFLPAIKIASSHEMKPYYLFYSYLMPPIVSISAALLLLATISFWIPVHVKKYHCLLNAIFVLCLMPSLLIIAQTLVLIFYKNAPQPIFHLFHPYINLESWRFIHLHLLPGIAGACVFLGRKSSMTNN